MRFEEGACLLREAEADLVALALPFQEKEAAKALGARWDPVARTWRVARRQDMSAFSRWP